MNKNDVTVNYAFQEYIPEKKLNEKGIKGVSKILTYEEPRWTLKDTASALKIIKEADSALYETIQSYIREQHLPSENTLQLDFGKSLRYDDEYMGDFSKETLSDKLDNRFIVRYSHDNDEGNLIDGGDEIIINDKELVSLFNGMIEGHVKENIQKYDEYKIKREASQKNEVWIWKDYDDLSGHLVAPDGKSYFSYDWTTKEYKVTPDSTWDSFLDADPTRDTSLTAFKEYAQKFVKENIVKDRDIKIIFERDYIDTEKLLEEEEKRMAKSETLADKYNRMEKLFDGKMSHLGSGNGESFNELCKWVEEEFPEKDSEAVLLEATSRMIEEIFDFDEFNYQNYDDVYGFGDGAEWRFDLSDSAAEKLLSGEILNYYEAQNHIWEKAKKEFAELKNSPQYKDEIEITDRINSAFRIADYLYPEFTKEIDKGKNLLADEWPQYSKEEKKNVINNAFEHLDAAFKENRVILDVYDEDRLIIVDKTIPLKDFETLIKGHDAVNFGKKSLSFVRPNAEQLHDGIENSWEFDEITTGYAIFQNPDLDVKGGFTPKFISKLDDMNVFESDGDAAKQYGIDRNCRILEEKKDIWIGDEDLEYYSYPDIPENRRIMKENGWLLEQPLEFDFSEFTEKDFNRIRDELFKDNPKEDYYGRLHIGSLHVEFVINQNDGFVDTNYYILGEKGEGEIQFGVPYGHFPGHQFASNLFTDNTYEEFKEKVTKAVLDDIAEEGSLKPEAMRPLIDWNDEQQCNELYHIKLVESARVNEIVIAPYSREERDVEAVRDFVSKIVNLPVLGVPDNMVFAVLDNIGRVQDENPGDFLKIRKDGSVEHISALGPVEKEPVEVLHIINSFAEDHASVSEEGSQQRKDYEYINSLYEKMAEKNVTVDAPSVDSYKEMLEIIQEQIEKESGIKVDERIADEIYSRYKEHDLTLKYNENGSFTVYDDADGKYTNPITIKDAVKQVMAWDDKELSELHQGTADDETITKINGYIEKLEHINEKIIERSKEEEKLVNEEKLLLDYDTIKELPDAHEEDIKKYCNIRFGMNIDDKTAIEINDFYWNNDNPLYLHKSPAGNLYVINDLKEEVKQADGEIMVNGSRFRQMDEEKQFEYIKNNFDDENFDEMLEQLGEGRVQVISDALARSFATLDKHEDLWRKLLEKGANPERSIKVVAEDANLGDNLNWLLDNIDKTELKNIFSDNGYADSVFEIAKESVTNDIGSWKTGSDIGFEGFMRIAKLCDREIDAERYYGKVLEKAFEKPVEPAIYGLLDSPERLAAYMNNHRISSNEPTISVEQAADILRYSRYEDYKFYTAKEGNAYILDVSEDYSGEGSRANNFDILTLAHDMAEKALDEEYHDYTEESYKRLDSLYNTYRHHFNPETNLSFTDDIDKMRDFDSLSKYEFLSSYGYLTEEEYDATAKELKERGRTGNQVVKALCYKEALKYLELENESEKQVSIADKIQSSIERLTEVSISTVATELDKSEIEIAEMISTLLNAKDYMKECYNIVRPTGDEILEKLEQEIPYVDILKTELSWKELGLNPEDYDRTESGTETEKDFKEWAMGLELENTLDLHGFDTALEGVSSWNNSTISEQKWMIIDKLSEEIVSGKLKIKNSQDAFDKLLKENEVYKDFVQKGIVKDDAFGLREITEKELKSVSAKEPVDIIKEIATQKELAEVPELFTREFKNRMKTRFPGPEKDPFIVAKAIINDWKTSKPDYIPALNKWLSDSLKKEGFSTKENLEKGFEKFFKKLSSPEQKRMQHKDSDIGQGR